MTTPLSLKSLPSTTTSSGPSSHQEKHHILLHATTIDTGILTTLPTVIAYVNTEQRRVVARALLDICSQTSIVCRSLVERLWLQIYPVANIDMRELRISSPYDPLCRMLLSVKVIHELDLKTQARHLSLATREQYASMKMADTNFHTSSSNE
ncbi:unnamed protein product [Ceratitis capitata]|uniref:(Mediterranean fruit fly) hypothetical protein n=1 Tax=Ceratitis capitata TaxID=7213 RepID=A0A811VB12_CERCA|nr:unnamed protein product [Ceratitis capitata]